MKRGIQIGVMQGRLLPPVDGRIQAFPAIAWRDEFSLAQKLGLYCIEWIYEVDNEDLNPFRSEESLEELRLAIDETGVQVVSICADYYMERFLINNDGSIALDVVDHLCALLRRAGSMAIKYVILPFVDASSLSTTEQIQGLAKLFERIMPVAESVGVEIHLETDFPPEVLKQIYSSNIHPLLKANYDIGNSAALGFEPEEEFSAMGERLGSVHVKDRVLGGGTVPPGEGNADFSKTFSLIEATGFSGPFILQCAREEGMSETDLANRNCQFVRDSIENMNKG